MKFTSIATLVALTQANEAVDQKVKEFSLFLNDKTVKIDDKFSSSEYLASDASAKKDALWA